MRLVFFGLSISSSWGNGHATCYRGLLKALNDRGHSAVFYERRTEWYDSNCDLPAAPYCDIRRYRTWPPPDAAAAAAADVVVLGSLAGDGRAIAGWLPGRTAALLVYYDIDTPKTLTAFAREGAAAYLSPRQLPAFDLVLSFAGGPVLDELRRWGRAARRRSTAPSIPPCTARPSRPRPTAAIWGSWARSIPTGGRRWPSCSPPRPWPARSAASSSPGRTAGRATGRRTWGASATSTPGSTPPTTPAATGSST